MALINKISTAGLTTLTTTYNGNLLISTGASLAPDTGFRFTEHLRSVKAQSRVRGVGSKLLLTLGVLLTFSGVGLLVHRLIRTLPADK
jgi:hypothetical protein